MLFGKKHEDSNTGDETPKILNRMLGFSGLAGDVRALLNGSPAKGPTLDSGGWGTCGAPAKESKNSRTAMEFR